MFESSANDILSKLTPEEQLNQLKLVNKYCELFMIFNLSEELPSLQKIILGNNRKFLLSIFKDTKNIYDLIKTDHYYVYAQREQENEFIRQELWILPDASRHSHRKPLSYLSNDEIAEAELLNISHDELIVRFIISFIHAHGTILTKMKLFNFQEVAFNMLREFRILLSIKPLPDMMKKLIMVLSTNMFSIKNIDNFSIIEDTNIISTNYPKSMLYESTVQMSWEIMRLIIDKCNQLLNECMEKNNGNSFNDVIGGDIEVLMDPITVWCDWLMENKKVIRLVTTKNLIGYIGESYWTRFAYFANTLEKIKMHFKLPENILPIKDSKYCLNQIYCILFFVTDFLCKEDKISPIIFTKKKSDTGVIEYTSVVYESCLLLDIEKFEIENTTEIQVKPRLIVLDLGCFMGSLLVIEKLIQYFLNVPNCTFMVPTFVLTKLESLVMESKCSIAEQALNILKNPELTAIVKFVTVEGSIYEHIAFLEGDNITMGNVVHNLHYDNLVRICLNLYTTNLKQSNEIAKVKYRLLKDCNYYNNIKQTFRNVADTYFMYRDVVLLSNNYNIIKYVQSLKIPARTPLDFLKWLDGYSN